MHAIALGFYFFALFFFGLKIVWNVFLPLALYLRPPEVIQGQENISLVTIIEVSLLLVLLLASLFIFWDGLIYKTWFVAVVGTLTICISYVPLFVLDYFFYRPRRKRK
jgi:hypothetical protein